MYGRALLVVVICLIAAPAIAEDLSGRVVAVHDGDTLTVLVERQQVKIRLAEVDAPELKQPFGTRSRQSLAEMCFQKAATVRVVNRDRYGRTVGRVDCDGTDANREQVQRGLAWVYDRYVKDRSLYADQNDARSARRGLWTDPNPIAPWEWRRTRHGDNAHREQ